MSDPEVHTTGAVARQFGVPTWQVRRLYETGRLSERTPRAGQYRMVAAADVPAVGQALRDAGYLPRREAPACSA